MSTEVQNTTSSQHDAKLPVISRYSCSLVYRNQNANLLRVLITNAYSEEEALGKAIKYFETEAKGYDLSMKCVIQIENNGL